MTKFRKNQYVLVWAYFLSLCSTQAKFLTATDYENKVHELEKSFKGRYPTLESKKYADTVQQAGGSPVIYYRNDKTEPFFISHDANEEIGKKFIVLKRGDDYISKENDFDFVVLSKKGSGGEYTVHKGFIE